MYVLRIYRNFFELCVYAPERYQRYNRSDFYTFTPHLVLSFKVKKESKSINVSKAEKVIQKVG